MEREMRYGRAIVAGWILSALVIGIVVGRATMEKCTHRDGVWVHFSDHVGVLVKDRVENHTSHVVKFKDRDAERARTNVPAASPKPEPPKPPQLTNEEPFRMVMTNVPPSELNDIVKLCVKAWRAGAGWGILEAERQVGTNFGTDDLIRVWENTMAHDALERFGWNDKEIK